MKLAPSILAADLGDLRSVLGRLAEQGADLVHWDVMDGHFVPNLTFGPPLIAAARAYTTLPFDVHLMCADPAQWISALETVQGLATLSFQIEATHFAPRLCGLIREQGVAPSVALNPQTSLYRIEEVLEIVDNVLVMSVDPGFYGQPFLEAAYGKLERLAALRERHRYGFSIQVDGGVNAGNAARLAALGVDCVVAGKAFFGASDPAAFARLVHGA